jgi:hypothetical protein
MFSEQHKLIYLHAPKTGGNSIQTVLLPYSADRKIVTGFRDGVDRFEVCGNVTATKHATLADYALALGDKHSDYRVAISVRHPFDRAISAFFSPSRWMQQSSETWRIEKPVWDRKGFIAFLNTLPTLVSFLTVGGVIRRPDFLIRYEALQRDFRRLLLAIGMPPIELPHVNRSAAPDELMQSVLADGELRSIVCERYASDLQMFGYDENAAQPSGIR